MEKEIPSNFAPSSEENGKRSFSHHRYSDFSVDDPTQLQNRSGPANDRSHYFSLQSFIHIYIHTYINTHIHTYIYTYIYSLKYTNIHTHTHTYIQISSIINLLPYFQAPSLTQPLPVSRSRRESPVFYPGFPEREETSPLRNRKCK